MTGWVPSLAQATPLGDDRVPTPSGSKITTLLANDAALVVLAGLFLTLLLAPWAARYWRRTGRRHRKFKGLEHVGIPAAVATPGALAVPRPLAVSSGPGTSSKPVAAPPRPTPPAPAPAPAKSASRASRRRVRAHRPRNPTLAEIGGLPPLRPDPDSPPAAP